MKFALRILPLIVILALGFWGYRHFLPSDNVKKTVHKRYRRPPQQTAVQQLRATDYKVHLTSQGTVKARTIISLTPLVAGRVLHTTDHFLDGAFFHKGDTLVQLDRTDFLSQVVIAEAALARSQSALAQEKARAAQALRNWKDIGFNDKPNDLVLRIPQLKEARANVAAQQAALDRAKRNLQRTTITAPFDGRVRSCDTGPGQSVGTGSKLGEIYATDIAEVRLPLSARQLTQIHINELGDQAIPVTLKDALNKTNPTTWNATIKHVEGELDEVSRELYVIAEITDPFGIKSGKPPIRINQPVIASIAANTHKNVILIDRKHIYGANDILLVEDGKLLRITINPIWTTADTLIVPAENLAGKLLVTTRLSNPHSGTPVGIITPKNETPNASNKSKSTKRNKLKHRHKKH